MRYLAVELADCDERPFKDAMRDLIYELRRNHPIVASIRTVVLDNVPFEEVEKLS